MTEILIGIVSTVVATALLAAIGMAARRSRQRRPLDIDVEQVIPEKWSVVFPGPPPDCSHLEGELIRGSELHKRFIEMGAIDHRFTRICLRIRGLASETVEIRNISVESTRSAPIAGTRVTHPTAGANEALLLRFDLDDEDPRARQGPDTYGTAEGNPEPYFDVHNITVAKDEVCQLVIDARTVLSLCHWRLILNCKVGSRRFEQQVGPPWADRFATSGDPEGDFETDLIWAWYDGHRLIPAG